jgi:hypothetical protein
MTALEMRNPGLADTKAGAGIDTDTRTSSTDRTTLQASRHKGPRPLIVLASWLVRIEHRMRQREIPVGWDAVLSLQLDRLTDIRERLDEYLGSERRRP